MPASLSQTQIAQYHHDGYLFPVECLTHEEVATFPLPSGGIRTRPR